MCGLYMRNVQTKESACFQNVKTFADVRYKVYYLHYSILFHEVNQFFYNVLVMTRKYIVYVKYYNIFSEVLQKY